MGTRAAVYCGQRTCVGSGKVREDVRMLRSHGANDEIRSSQKNCWFRVLRRTILCNSMNRRWNSQKNCFPTTILHSGYWISDTGCWSGVAVTEQPVKTGRRLRSDSSCSALYSRGASPTA
ncbi:hypothetical protein PV326_012817 [Microctonus aethiopoides]|nr:hypothetical protein PV326_012817 [Microctonus aethiopoides]